MTGERRDGARQPSPTEIRLTLHGYGPRARTSNMRIEKAIEIVRLVEKGAQRGDIAARFGVDPRTVNRWQQLIGFTWSRPADPRLAELPELLSTSLTLAEIGDRFGVTGTTIRRWAKRLGLHPRAKRPSPSRRAGKLNRREEITRLVERGLDDQTIAVRLGVSPRTVAIHRRGAGLFYTQPVPIDPEEFTALFRRGLSDPEIAEQMGLTPGTVQVTRSRLGLRRT